MFSSILCPVKGYTQGRGRERGRAGKEKCGVWEENRPEVVERREEGKPGGGARQT